MIAGDSQGTVHILIMFLVIGGKKNALVVRKKENTLKVYLERTQRRIS